MNTRIKRTLFFTIALALSLSMLAVAQNITSLTTSAKGKGTISISNIDKHQIYSVLIILKENGDAELTFIADLQLSAQGTWSMGKSLKDGINLKITGGVVTGNATGSGKLFLRDDGKSIDKLNIEAKAADDSKVTVDFVAEKPAAKPNN